MITMINRLKVDTLAVRKLAAKTLNGKTEIKKNLLVTLLSECQVKGKTKNRETTDEECLLVVKSFLKKTNMFLQSLAETSTSQTKLLLEQSILTSYLPKQLSNTELSKLTSQFSNVGEFMKFLKTEHANCYDGKTASSIFKTDKKHVSQQEF